MNQLFEKVNPIFSKFQFEKNIEFEMRLGKVNRGTFDTNVGQVTFEKILEGLKKYKGWESTKKTNDVAYYHDNIRLVINDDTEESIQVVKDKLSKIDHVLTGQPLDVRFAVAKETPIENNGDIEYSTARQRNRESFIRKNLSIDMTIVAGNPADLDSEEENMYQVEFEIIDPKLIKDHDTLYNIIYKVHDVLKLVVPS
jgi:hypothetical protein